MKDFVGNKFVLDIQASALYACLDLVYENKEINLQISLAELNIKNTD